MSPEASKKTPRTFHCRESLWQKFEQMAQELECSVDYLINDAMKQYARQRGYGASASMADFAAQVPATVGASPPPAPPQTSLSGSGSHSQAGSSPGVRPTQAQARPVPAMTAQPATVPPVAAVAVAAPTQPTPAVPAAGPAIPPRTATGANPRLPPLPTLRSVPPPSRVAGGTGATPRAAGQPTPPPKGSGTLAVYYKGEFFKINKDRFVIGRGKQASDLTIKDPNVSRQHAMIEFLNGHYFIVDMGSTNGVEFEGQRVQRKAIADGDIFRVCDHELLFVYQ